MKKTFVIFVDMGDQGDHYYLDTTVWKDEFCNKKEAIDFVKFMMPKYVNHIKTNINGAKNIVTYDIEHKSIPKSGCFAEYDDDNDEKHYMFFKIFKG